MGFFKKIKNMFKGKEEEQQRQEEQAKLEEQQRQEEQAKLEEQQRREEQAKLEEQQRREEQAKLEEQQRQEEQAKLEEEQRREEQAKREAEQRREEQAKLEEQQRREEQAKLEEQQRQEEQAKLEEQQRREEQAKLEEQQRREEQAKLEEQQRQEEQAKLEEQQRREEQAKLEEQQRREENQNLNNISESFEKTSFIESENQVQHLRQHEEPLSKKEQKSARKEEKRKLKEEKKALKRDKFEVFDKYKQGMQKTRSSLIGNLKSVFNSYSEISEELYEDLEEIFIMADIGVDTVLEMMDKLRESVLADNIVNPNDLQELIVDKLFDIYVKGQILNTNIKLNKEGLSVILFVGVNGSGKTTTISKIANMLVSEGKSVLLAAGDTFRAGAIDQLKVWGERIGIDTITREPGSDPSAVMYDAIEEAKKRNVDVLLCDTAGRLQNKVNLMKELEKIKRVISREIEDAPHETLLVIDATTGQNGMSQAKHFLEATNVTGVVLTKLDGTAKGGIALAIRNELNLPIKFVTLGEKMDDLEYFDIESYMYGLFSDLFDE